MLLCLLLACSEQAPADAAKAPESVAATETQEEKSGSDHTVAALPGLPARPDAHPQEPSQEYLMGKFSPQSRPDFAVVKKPYTTRSGMMLRKEALAAFEKMWTAAQAEGVKLDIISSTRTFQQQKAIWEGKWLRFAKQYPDPQTRALKILEYSSMPGSSRHHWGTDVDLNDLNNAAFEKGGKHEKVYAWLAAHAHEYGFCQPYTPGRPHGYQEEKWHWSYVPLSKPLLGAYAKSLTDAAFSGFQGAETAASIQVAKHYVLGVNADCATD
ncbi:MAG TPA: M15 family metallopeptidase [Saprospiraceae bacterium]|nr:M15 family metallopeptidase [Saprospiraceae bacterium]